MPRRSTSERDYERIPAAEQGADPFPYEKHLTLKDLLYTVRRRVWIPIACLVVFVAGALFLSLRTTPMYKATAQVEIERESYNVLPSVQDVVSVDTRYYDYVNTQQEILRSSLLAKAVAEELAAPGTHLPSRKGQRPNPLDANLTADGVRAMTNKIEVVRDTRLIDISAQSQNPKQAARIANRLAEMYIEQAYNKKVEAIRKAAGDLRTELDKAQEEVDAAELTLASYKTKNDIVSLEKGQNLVEEQLSQLTMQAAAARGELKSKEARYTRLKELLVKELVQEKEIADDPRIQELRTREAQLAGKVRQGTETKGETDPEVVQSKNELASVQEALDDRILAILDETRDAYLRAKTKEIKEQKEADYRRLRALALRELRHEEEVTGSKLIESLKTAKFDAERKVEQLAERYGERHPKMVEARNELAGARNTIDEEILKIVGEVRNSYLSARQKESDLIEAVRRVKEDAHTFASLKREYEKLQRSVEGKKKIYDDILQRGQETGISERTEQSSVRIVDRAIAPKRPFKPRTKRNLMLAVLMALVVGTAGTFVVEHLNEKVEGPEDIEVFLARPFLGAVPIIPDRFEGVDKKGTIAHLSPESTTAEAYKTVLAGIQYSPASNSLKTILVTSAGPAEGKTTTLTNLGISAAQNGRRVLLVDCDLRKPAIHRIFGLDKERGLTDYLSNHASMDEIVQETDVPNLFAVSRGSPTPNPSGLISSPRMKEFAEGVRDGYDLVFFDSPPCTVVADPLILTSLVDAVINVTQSGKFHRKMIGRGIDLLEGVNANVIGVVLNEVKERDHRYYYYYGYSYYSKEGKRGDGKKKRAHAKSNHA